MQDKQSETIMRVELGRYHRLAAKHGGLLLFSPDTLRLWTADEPLGSIIESFVSGASCSDLAPKLGVSEQSVRQMLSDISKRLAVNSTAEFLSEEDIYPACLTRLVIYTTTACNLRCTYCYVRREPRFMTSETAHQVVVKCIAGFPRIRAVQFFGGEPALNVPIIAQLCAEFTEACRLSGTPRPVFGIMTNLTILDELLINLIQEYTMRVTVSIDGPKGLHDHSRQYCSGGGTFDVVTRNLRRLREHTNAEVTIEATYTRAHWEAGLRLTDLEEYLSHTFGIASVIVVPVHDGGAAMLSDPSATEAAVPPEAITEMICEQSRLAIASYATPVPRMGNQLNARIIAKLIIRRACSPLFCGAGLSTLAVYPDGELYPCNRLAGFPEFQMGTVHDSFPFKTERFRTVQQRFATTDKRKLEKCRSCWARRLCRTCVAKTLHTTGDLGPPTDLVCRVIKQNLETVLHETSALAADEDKWARVTELVCAPAER